MKKYFILTLIAFSFIAQAQISANRFFYELTYKPKVGSDSLEKVMSVLDIMPEKSFFRDYTMVAQDSILKVQVEEMQRAGVYKDISKSIKMPKFSYKITKKYPSMEIQYVESILSGFTPINLAYNETPNFNWKISNETIKIGEYNTQKATTDFGGRSWIAWFSKDIPLQDGPYKFSGLPGLIVKIEDTDKNFSWELKGNKPEKDFQEYTYMEKMQAGGGTPKILEVKRDKFETTFSDYKKDPFATLRSQIPAEAMKNKMPGSDKTIGEMVKEQEKMVNDFYGATDNPIELSSSTKKK